MQRLAGAVERLRTVPIRPARLRASRVPSRVDSRSGASGPARFMLSANSRRRVLYSSGAPIPESRMYWASALLGS